eukprot:9946558-Lingulodinium_polyedra.AAC.1
MPLDKWAKLSMDRSPSDSSEAKGTQVTSGAIETGSSASTSGSRPRRRECGFLGGPRGSACCASPNSP